MKANIGCGSDVRSGYMNYDKYPLNQKVEFLDMDVVPYPLKDDMFDHVETRHTLEHLRMNKRDVLKELHRITCKNGTVVVELPLHAAMECHTSFYHPLYYLKPVYDRKTNMNTNYGSNLFCLKKICLKDRKSVGHVLYTMKNRFFSWVASFFYDSVEWTLEVKK